VSASKANLRFGTSSWSEKSWTGAFYPAGTKAGDQLTFYATQFGSVEVDATYYRVPSRAMVRGWRAKTPEEFTIAGKFPRSIVHGGEGATPDASKVLKLEHVGEDLDAFLWAMRELGPRAGPLVVQLPYFNREAFASVGPFLDRLVTFLDALPDDFRYGVEVRNKNWIGKPLLDVLSARRVALVLVDLPYMPHPLDLPEDLVPITTDFTYVRLIGDRKAVEAATQKFDQVVLDRSDSLERWATWLALHAPQVRETFAYANNHFAGHGPATIRELARRVSERLG
jgi:uncharacterized protein YecE (DUF72 family)